MTAMAITEGAHGVTLTQSTSSLQAGGGKPGQGYAAVLVIGLDIYNKAKIGSVSKTLNSKASDADHVPCVMMVVI